LKFFSIYENIITPKCACQVFSQIAYLKTFKPVIFQLVLLMSKLGCNPWYQKKTLIRMYDNSPCNLQEYDEQCGLKGLKIIAIYIDSAVLNEAKSDQSFGWVHGLTTNSILLARTIFCWVCNDRQELPFAVHHGNVQCCIKFSKDQNVSGIPPGKRMVL
jgi:hypothetical protein